MSSKLLILILLIIKLSVTQATLSELSRELIGEGLISIDSNGIPTTECMVYVNGTSIVQTCAMSEGFGARSVGCFTLWTPSGFVQQGCYSGQEISLRGQCRKGQCKAGNKKAVSFCCCHGPLCNADIVA